MRYIFVIAILLFVPGMAFGAHQNTQCSVSLSGNHLPVVYNGEKRTNPDGTFYPGDGFHYLFTFRASPECISFSVKPIISEGISDVISHQSIMWDNHKKNIHSHKDLEMQPKYLTTTHYYVDKIHHCRNNNENCQSLVLADNPSYSVREDKTPSSSLQRLLKGLSTASTYTVRTEETHDWGFTDTDGSHEHGKSSHTNESDESITSFENYVQSKCNNLEKYSGCVFGHVELETLLIDKKCMFVELNKMNISHDIEKDFCVNVNHKLSLSVTGTKIVCNNDKCKTVKVTRNSNLTPKVLESDFVISTKHTPIRDLDYYETKNLDDTYYHHDSIGITHEPLFPWKSERATNIQFDTTRTHNLLKEYEFDCNDKICLHTIKTDGIFPTNHTIHNGDGITILNTTIQDVFGYYTINYQSTVSNINRDIGIGTGEMTIELVPYEPQYSQGYPYPLLIDSKEYSFDDRQAIALYYMGSTQDGIVHSDRKSLINGFYNFGYGYDPYYPSVISQNFTFSQGVAYVDSLESSERNSMFVKEGYGRMYFDYPLGEIVGVNHIANLENVTTHTTLSSNDFAAKDTFLNYYSMRYPEIPFTKHLTIKSVNQNGTIMNDLINLKILPYKKINTEYISQYIYDKILFDTKDKIFAEIISNDTYPMYQEYSSNGVLYANITRTPIFFDEYHSQTDQGTFFNGSLSNISQLNKSPDTLRLSLPYDIGLGSLSPTSFVITVNDFTNILDERYYTFGGKQEININVQKDNKLPIHRSLGKIEVYSPSNFGDISELLVDGTSVKQKCERGCVLLFQPEKELIITAKNMWNGEASVISPKFIIPVPPQSEEPNYKLIVVIIVVLVAAWLIYKKFKSE